MFCGLRVLGHNHTALALDGLHPQGAVATGAREYYADGPLVLVLGQGPEEKVDGHTPAARGHRIEQLQRAVQKRHVAIGRDDVGTVGLHRHAVLDLKYLHTSVAPNEIGQDALVVWGQMLNKDKGHTRISVRGHAGEESLEGRQAPGRCPDAHNGKITGLPIGLQLGVNGVSGLLRRHAGFRFPWMFAGQLLPVFFSFCHIIIFPYLAAVQWRRIEWMGDSTTDCVLNQ